MQIVVTQRDIDRAHEIRESSHDRIRATAVNVAIARTLRSHYVELVDDGLLVHWPDGRSSLIHYQNLVPGYFDAEDAIARHHQPVTFEIQGI